MIQPLTLCLPTILRLTFRLHICLQRIGPWSGQWRVVNKDPRCRTRVGNCREELGMVLSTWPQNLIPHSQDQGRYNAAEVLVVFPFQVEACLYVYVCVRVCTCVCVCVCVCEWVFMFASELREDVWVSLCVAPWVLPCRCVMSACIYIWECVQPHVHWKYDSV